MSEQEVQRLKEAVQAQPDSADAHFALGVALADLGAGRHRDLRAAAAEMREVVRLRPGDIDARNRLFGWLMAAGAFPDVGATVVKMMGDSVTPETYKPTLREIRRDAAERQRKVALLHHHYDDEDWRQQLREELAGTEGIDSICERNTGHAIDLYMQAINIDPRCSQAYYSMGDALHDVARIHLHRGNEGEARQALEFAEKALMRLVEMVPDHAEGYNVLGLVRRDRGDRKGAVDALEAALRIDPANTAAKSNLARIRQELGEQPADDAGGKYASWCAACDLITRNEIDAAIPLLQQAVRADPCNGYAFAVLGTILDERGHLDEALGLLYKANDLLPDDPVVEAFHNWVLHQKGVEQGYHNPYMAPIMGDVRRSVRPDFLRELVKRAPRTAQDFAKIAAAQAERERKRQAREIAEAIDKEEARKRQAAIEAKERRRKDLTEQRRAQGLCILCGKKLGFLEKLGGTGKHGGCTNFQE